MSPKKIAIVSLIVSSILWASSGTVAKILLPSIDPIPLMMLRIGIGISILIPMYLTKPHKPFLQTIKDTWPAILGATGNFLLFILGISLTTANAAGIIYTITPLLTLFLARKTIQELYTPRRFYGILLGLFGVAGVMYKRKFFPPKEKLYDELFKYTEVDFSIFCNDDILISAYLCSVGVQRRVFLNVPSISPDKSSSSDKDKLSYNLSSNIKRMQLAIDKVKEQGLLQTTEPIDINDSIYYTSMYL